MQYRLKHSTIIAPITLKIMINILVLLLTPCLSVTIWKMHVGMRLVRLQKWKAGGEIGYITKTNILTTNIYY